MTAIAEKNISLKPWDRAQAFILVFPNLWAGIVILSVWDTGFFKKKIVEPNSKANLLWHHDAFATISLWITKLL